MSTKGKSSVLMTVAEASKMTGLSTHTVRRMIDGNANIPARKVGNRYYLNRKSFVDWVEQEFGVKVESDEPPATPKRRGRPPKIK